MPTESRANPLDQFFQFSLLGMIAAGYGAVATSGSLDMPSLVLPAAALLVRLALVTGLFHFSLSERAASLLALAYIVFYPVDYLFLSNEFLRSTVHLVFFIGSVLLLKASTHRDFRLLELIAFLQMLAGSVLSINSLYLLFLTLFLLASVAALAAGEVHTKLSSSARVTYATLRGARRGLALLSLSAFAAILGLGVMFFVLLPRTAHAALGHLLPGRFHLAGFSNEVTLGQIGEIRLSSTPVMHTRLYTSSAGIDLKWRGATLSQFDGRRWFNDVDRGETIPTLKNQARLATLEQQSRPGRRIQYEVQLKSATDDVLFFLGIPEMIFIDSPQIIRTSAGGFRAGSLSPSRYEATSFLDNPLTPPLTPPVLSAESRRLHLQTPPMDPAVSRLAHSLTASRLTSEAKARVIENHLRTRYGYTTQLLSQPVGDPIAHFLFTRREGHCEYFASAMAVMLRDIGIPSRIVTGFQSGTFNPISSWYLVRSSDAHAWVEAWIDGRGWVAFDPTPSGPAPGPAPFWHSAALYLDALELFWQDWVMSYDLERQFILANRVGQNLSLPAWTGQGPSDYLRQAWHALVSSIDRRAAAGAASVCAAVFLLWLFAPRLWTVWRRRRTDRLLRSRPAQSSDATLLYERLLAALHLRGNEKPGWLTPREFARTLGNSPHAPLVHEATELYHELRYGARSQPVHRLLDIVTTLERSQRP